MAHVYVGTSGYSYRDWVGPYYPAGTRQSDFFRLYAADFPFVELNFSYYKQPQPDIMKRLLGQTGKEFLFAVKAHGSLTHEITDAMDRDCDAFRSGIAPLLETGQLAAVLFQFPFSFHYTGANRIYLDRLAERFHGVRSVFEFRNAEWQKESVYAGLAERNLGLVLVDEPDLPGLLKPDIRATSDTAYIRFHGRNKDNWWKGTNTTRYDYLYDREELSEWLSRIMAILEKVKILLVAFNNHYKAQAVHNARLLKKMLQDAGVAGVR